MSRWVGAGATGVRGCLQKHVKDARILQCKTLSENLGQDVAVDVGEEDYKAAVAELGQLIRKAGEAICYGFCTPTFYTNNI